MRKALFILLFLPLVSFSQEAESIIEERIEWVSQDLEGEDGTNLSLQFAEMGKLQIRYGACC